MKVEAIFTPSSISVVPILYVTPSALRCVRISLHFLGYFIAFILSGCAATTPYQLNNFTPAKSPVNSTVRMTRENSVLGSAVVYAVYDNGRAVGELGPGGTLEWQRSPGYLELYVRNVGVDPRRELHEIVVTKHFRYGELRILPYSSVVGKFIEDVIAPGETRSYSCPRPQWTEWVPITPLQPLASSSAVALAKKDAENGAENGDRQRFPRTE